MSTSDAVYASKAGNLTVVVRVQDDDTAGIVLENPDAILPLTEGEAAGAKLTVTGLSSAPLHDVTLRVTTSLPSLVTVEPSSILIRKGDWASVSREVTVRALQGQYGGVTSASVVLTPESADPKYNVVAARATKAVAITLTTTQASLIGVPTEQQRWTEGGIYKYSVRLNTKPGAGVSVSAEVRVGTIFHSNLGRRRLSSSYRSLAPPEKKDHPCKVITSNVLTFTAANWNAEQEISIQTSDDGAFSRKIPYPTLAALLTP